MPALRRWDGLRSAPVWSFSCLPESTCAAGADRRSTFRRRVSCATGEEWLDGGALYGRATARACRAGTRRLGMAPGGAAYDRRVRPRDQGSRSAANGSGMGRAQDAIRRHDRLRLLDTVPADLFLARDPDVAGRSEAHT